MDAIQTEIFAHRLASITEEMGNQLVRSSFSPNIKERRDCSVALFDSSGRVVAQAAHIPIHLGSLLGGVEAVLEYYALDDMDTGDAFVCNDAYLAGGTHLPDIAIISPVFCESPVTCDSKVAFFVACLGHHADVGGAVPGSISPSARSIFEEGIRIPPTKLVHAGKLDDGLLRLIANNTREPEERMLDLRVQIAVNDAGSAKVASLVDKMGLEVVQQASRDLMAYATERIRNRVRALPEGVYLGQSEMDNDGVGTERVPIEVAMTVSDGLLRFDFAGTGAQSQGGYNVMPSGVMATVSYVLKAMLDPELPPNSGLFDAFELAVPEGTILNPRYPAAVGARTTTCQKLASALFKAMSQALPERKRLAAGHEVLAAMVFSGEREDEAVPRQGRDTYVYLETLGGGHGGQSVRDGMDGAHIHITNSLNMPIEAVEATYPLRIDDYELIADSGGAGRYRGGMGIRRTVRILGDGIGFGGRADGFHTRAPGAAGGGDGSQCRVVRNPDGNQEEILEPKQPWLALERGERIAMETPGGGGYGLPGERDLRALADDLFDDRISEAGARSGYGDSMVDAALALQKDF